MYELTKADRDYLELQTRARTIQAQTVIRARIILLKADGISIDEIADKVGINIKSVMLCIKKYKEGGIENALFDAPGRGRLQFDENGSLIPFSGDEQTLHVLSYDEKPGIQAIATTSDDLRPDEQHSTILIKGRNTSDI